MRLARHLLLVGLAALAGCGTGDAEEREREIASGVEETTATRDVAVDCPDDLDPRAGDEYECSLSAAGGVRAKVRVRQVGDAADEIRWEVVAP